MTSARVSAAFPQRPVVWCHIATRVDVFQRASHTFVFQLLHWMLATSSTALWSKLRTHHISCTEPDRSVEQVCLMCCAWCVSGVKPYKVEPGVAYLGYDLVVFRQPDSAAHTVEQCATACTQHQGRVRCSAWTYNNTTEAGSSCSLKMFKGFNPSSVATSTSGHIAGIESLDC